MGRGMLKLNTMTISQAKMITGGLSFPSKLPGSSFGISAKICVTGSKLASVPGSVCHSCYALHGGGSYARTNVIKAHQRRLSGLSHPRWVTAMVTLLRHYHSKPLIRVDLGLVGVRRQQNGGERHQWNESGWHRWHDSGDLQSVEHLQKICDVAFLTPRIRHWLPTQELGMVRQHLAQGGEIPPNLTIRVSSVMIDEQAKRSWPQTSSVFKTKTPEGSHVCPAPKQDHKCGSCRACWKKNVPHIAYEFH